MTPLRPSPSARRPRLRTPTCRAFVQHLSDNHAGACLVDVLALRRRRKELGVVRGCRGCCVVFHRYRSCAVCVVTSCLFIWARGRVLPTLLHEDIVGASLNVVAGGLSTFVGVMPKGLGVSPSSLSLVCRCSPSATYSCCTWSSSRPPQINRCMSSFAAIAA